MVVRIWCEMYISDLVAHLFKNLDTRGTQAANVSNSTVGWLSNLPLAKTQVVIPASPEPTPCR